MKRVFVLVSSCLISFVSTAQTFKEGLKALDIDKFEYARNIFSNLIKNEPAKCEYYYWLGECYINLYKSDSALLIFNKGLEVAPKYAPLYAGLGELLLADDKVTDAQIQFEIAKALCKNKAGYYIDAKSMIAIAEAMITGENKMLAEAEQLMNEAYEIEKNDYEVLVTAGDVFLEMQNGNGAATFYTRATVLNPNNPKAFARIALIWIKIKSFDAAKEALDAAFAKDSNYATAYKNQAEYFYFRGKYTEAKEAFKKYLQNSEPSTANKIRLVQILFKAKVYHESLAIIEDIQKTDKSNLFMNRLYAYSAYEVANTKNDVELCKKGLSSLEFFMSKVDRKKILVKDFEYLGKLQSKITGLDSLAILNLNIAMQMDTNAVELYQDLAKVYHKQKKFSDAVKTYEIYLSKAKKNTAFDNYTIGKYYYAARNFSKADSVFMSVNEAKPDYADAYYQRANTLSQIDTAFASTTPKVLYEKYIELTLKDSSKLNLFKKELTTAYSYIAYYYLVKENKKDAIVFYKKVLFLDPKNENALRAIKGLQAKKEKKKK